MTPIRKYLQASPRNLQKDFVSGFPKTIPSSSLIWSTHRSADIQKCYELAQP